MPPPPNPCHDAKAPADLSRGLCPLLPVRAWLQHLLLLGHVPHWPQAALVSSDRLLVLLVGFKAAGRCLVLGSGSRGSSHGSARTRLGTWRLGKVSDPAAVKVIGLHPQTQTPAEPAIPLNVSTGFTQKQDSTGASQSASQGLGPHAHPSRGAQLQLGEKVTSLSCCYDIQGFPLAPRSDTWGRTQFLVRRALHWKWSWALIVTTSGRRARG